MSNLGLTKKVMCRFCKTEEEASKHILLQYQRLARLRLECLGELYPDTRRYMKITRPKLKRFIKKAELDRIVYIQKSAIDP